MEKDVAEQILECSGCSFQVQEEQGWSVHVSLSH